MTLKDYSTNDLAAELQGRKEVTKIAVGPYRNYRLGAKYGADRDKEILSENVLLINHSIL